MDYIIHKRTSAMTMMDSKYFRTKIIETDNILYLKEDPLTIVKNSCEHYGYTLSVWNQLVKQTLRRSSKLPVPILPTKGLFFLPTTSYRNEHCAWISYYDIAHYMKKGNKLKIILENGHVIASNISLNQFKLQLKRTGIVIAYFYRLFYTTDYQFENEVAHKIDSKLKKMNKKITDLSRI